MKRFGMGTGLALANIAALLLVTGCGPDGVQKSPSAVAPAVREEARVAGFGVPIPTGGTSLLREDALPQLNRGPEAACAVFETVSGQGTGFAEAVRGRVLEPLPEHAWYAQLANPVMEDLQSGDVVLLSFWARTVEADEASGRGEFLIYFGTPNGADSRPEDAVEPAIYRKATVGSAWQQFLLPVQLERDFKKLQTSVNLDLGLALQTLEFAGIELRRYADRKPGELPDSSRAE